MLELLKVHNIDTVYRFSFVNVIIGKNKDGKSDRKALLNLEMYPLGNYWDM